MSERAIKLEHVRETIEFPDYLIKKDGKIESYKNFQNKVLKVVYSEQDNFINVITVIWK